MSNTPRFAFVAFGSNLGDSVKVVRDAMVRVEALSDGPVRASSLWRTTPVDCPPGSGDFINAVVRIVPGPEVTPESLLGTLQELEKEFGRRPKKILNEARPLDLDLIAFGNEVRSTPELTLPHPRAHLRRFVLEPFCEIAPEFILPGQQTSVSKLLKTVAGASTEMVARV